MPLQPLILKGPQINLHSMLAAGNRRGFVRACNSFVRDSRHLHRESIRSSAWTLSSRSQNRSQIRGLSTSPASIRKIHSADASTMTPPIAILGAGPAGLTLARLLELANIDYVIFERDQDSSWAFGRGGSGTLDLHVGSGLLAIEKADLMDQFKKYARTNPPTKIADSQGKLYLDLTPDADNDRPEIDRRDLRVMLMNSVPAEKIRWNSKVQKVQREGDGSMSVHLVNGTLETGFRLVVGADGAWSKARAMISSAKPSYQGILILTTSISSSSARYSTAESLAGRGNYIAIGGGKLFIIMKLGDETYYVGVGSKQPENWPEMNAELLKNAGSLREHLCKDFGGSAKSHIDVIRNSDGAFHTWQQYTLAPEDVAWENVPGVTLVGDAAHLTVTDGEGVNTAMYDSYLLSKEIVAHGLGDLDAAAAAYEREMQPRARKRMAEAIEGMPKMFSPEAPSPFIQEIMSGMNNT